MIPPALIARRPKLYATEKQSDSVAQVKLFTPWTDWTWYLLEYDGEDIAFAWVEGLESELGYVSLKELAAIRGPGGLTVECDIHFEPVPLSQLHNSKRRAHRAGHQRKR
jgi:hypothetical protein